MRELTEDFELARKRIVATREALEALGTSSISISRGVKKQFTSDDVYEALQQVGQPLADSYRQVKNDVDDNSRTSWAGSAHEIREILVNLLRILAPDDVVTVAPWYVEEKEVPPTKQKRVTQKQRVIYIMKQQTVGSAEEKVLKQIGTLEDMIGNMIRDSYSRASAAAHTFGGQKEAKKLLKFFEAFAYNLLNLD